MKKALIATTFLFSCVLIYIFIGIGTQNTNNHNRDEWQTYKKTSPQNIYSYPTTPEEKEEVKISSAPAKPASNEPSSKRAPASKDKTKPKRKQSIPGRNWSLHPGQNLPEKYSFLNEVNKEWKSLMGQDVLKFLRPETKLFIKSQESLTLLERNGARHVEQVYVKMVSPEGRHFSYQAYVDSETGNIIKTWNNTIHEPMGRKPATFKATGQLGPDGAKRF